MRRLRLRINLKEVAKPANNKPRANVDALPGFYACPESIRLFLRILPHIKETENLNSFILIPVKKLVVWRK